MNAVYNKHTTDNQEEMYDVVDENDQVIGTATRRQVHTNRNLRHRAAGGFVFNDKGELLLQKRSKTKDTAPGVWMLSVGGHVDTGMSYEDTIHRELMEELGVDMEVLPVQKLFVSSEVEQEIWMQYLGVHNGPFPDFNRVEAEEFGFFNLDELEERIQKNPEQFIQRMLEYIQQAKDLVRSKEYAVLLQRMQHAGH